MRFLLVGLLLCTACTETDKDTAEESDPETQENGSVCPSPSEDSCMTEAMYASCLTEEETCAGELVIASGCPYTEIECL